MTTANVTISYPNTNPWDVNCTALNMLSDVSIKDFQVINNTDAVIENSFNFTKVSATVLRYTGGSATLTNGDSITFRRKTPNSIVQTVSYASKFSSALWNSEIDRVLRWREEADLNGVGSSSSPFTPTISNSALSSTWASDTINAASRQAIYNGFNYTLSNANPGYYKLPGGLVVQYGSTVTTCNSGGYFSLLFPTAFLSVVLTITVTNGDSSAWAGYPTIVQPYALGGFNGIGYNPIPISLPVRLNWIAIGV